MHASELACRTQRRRCLLLAGCACLVPLVAGLQDKPVNLLIDTDMSVDVDDVGALCVAHALADRGEATILAVVHDTGFNLGAGALSVLNNYYGRDGLRIGAYRGIDASIGRPADTPHPSWTNQGKGHYVEDLVTRFPSRVRTSADAEDALDVYRSILAEASPKDVVLVSVGHLTNVLELLKSGPDHWSPLSGLELVAQKIRHVVIMGGRRHYDKSQPLHSQQEWNFGGCGFSNFWCGKYDYLGDITLHTLDLWPEQVPIAFVDYDVAAQVHTGPRWWRDKKQSPSARAYSRFCDSLPGWCENSGRASFDPVAVLYAVRGPQALFTLQPGKNFICNASDIKHSDVCHHHFTGHNFWTNFGPVMAGPWQGQSWRDQNGHPQVTVILSTDVHGNELPTITKLEHEIDTLLIAAPARRKSDPYAMFSSLPPSLPRKATMVPSTPTPPVTPTLAPSIQRKSNIIPSMAPPPVMPSARTSSSHTVSARTASPPVLLSPDASPRTWLSTPVAPFLGSLTSHEAYHPQNGLSGTSTLGILMASCMLGILLGMNRKRVEERLVFCWRYLRNGVTTVAVADNDADCNAQAEKKGRRARKTRTRQSKQARRNACEEAQVELPDQREPLEAGPRSVRPKTKTQERSIPRGSNRIQRPISPSDLGTLT